jgi:GNAT superfamily N-acetyltransferase
MIGPGDWRDWRYLRLRALADSPSAFGSTLARELAFDEADWRQLTPDSVLVYAEGVPVAMGATFEDEPGQMMIVAMWVEPDWRGRGLSTQVLDALVARVRGRGLRPHLWVNVVNEAARAAYRRYGFVVTDGSKDLHDGDVAEHMKLYADP